MKVERRVIGYDDRRGNKPKQPVEAEKARKHSPFRASGRNQLCPNLDFRPVQLILGFWSPEL
jgi:hypothetical protein